MQLVLLPHLHPGVPVTSLNDLIWDHLHRAILGQCLSMEQVQSKSTVPVSMPKAWRKAYSAFFDVLPEAAAHLRFLLRLLISKIPTDEPFGCKYCIGGVCDGLPLGRQAD